MESDRVRVDFLIAHATAHKVTTTAAANNKMSPALLNSGTVGLGDIDVVGREKQTLSDWELQMGERAEAA